MPHQPLRGRPLCVAALSILLAASTVSAQTYSYSPAGSEAFEGAGLHFALGSSSDGRCMLMDGELRGRARTLTEVAFRPHWTFARYSARYAPNLMAARSWTNVTLRISSCDMANISSRFDANPTSTPTMVFSGPLRWPGAGSLTGSHPLPFSLRFPFQTPWTDTGTEDVCLDFDFSGGKLGAPGSVASSPYFLSSFAKLKFQTTRNTPLPLRGTTSCSDSASPSVQAHVQTQAIAEGPLSPNPARRDTIQILTRPQGMVGPVVLGFGQQGSHLGTAIPGISCANLYLDLNASVFVGIDARSSFTSGLLPYAPNLRGSELWTQAAWLDSASSQLKLSDGVMQLVQELPPSRDIQRFYLNQPDPNLKASEGMGNGRELQPVIRYRH